MELISKNKLIKSIELGIKQLEESEENIVPNELGSPDIVIPCAIMLMKSMIEVVNMCDVIESRPKGKWTTEHEKNYSKYLGKIWENHYCSVCGEQADDNDQGEYLNKYCGNCGAEMEKE